jgi:hypothetical protein
VGVPRYRGKLQGIEERPKVEREASTYKMEPLEAEIELSTDHQAKTPERQQILQYVGLLNITLTYIPTEPCNSRTC